MPASLIIPTILEVSAVVLLVLGFIFEKKLIAFEDRAARAIARAIRKRRARNLEAHTGRPAVMQERAVTQVAYESMAQEQEEKPRKKKASGSHRVA